MQTVYSVFIHVECLPLSCSIFPTFHIHIGFYLNLHHIKGYIVNICTYTYKLRDLSRKLYGILVIDLLSQKPFFTI